MSVGDDSADEGEEEQRQFGKKGVQPEEER